VLGLIYFAVILHVIERAFSGVSHQHPRPAGGPAAKSQSEVAPPVVLEGASEHASVHSPDTISRGSGSDGCCCCRCCRTDVAAEATAGSARRNTTIRVTGVVPLVTRRRRGVMTRSRALPSELMTLVSIGTY
jgi:hypothetical protein